MNDNVTLRVNGREWNGWTSVRIGAGIERLARDFSVEITRQWPGDEGITTLQPRIKNGSKVEVLIGDELVITGWVEATPVRYDARSVSTGIAGRSLTADLIDCAAEPTQFNGRSLVQIAQALAAPFGIEVVNSDAPSGVIPDVQPDHGETVIEVINKILGQQQALAYDDPHGRLVIGGIGSTQAHTALVLGENILSCDTEKRSGSGFQFTRWRGSVPETTMISVRPPPPRCGPAQRMHLLPVTVRCISGRQGRLRGQAVLRVLTLKPDNGRRGRMKPPMWCRAGDRVTVRCGSPTSG